MSEDDPKREPARVRFFWVIVTALATCGGTYAVTVATRAPGPPTPTASTQAAPVKTVERSGFGNSLTVFGSCYTFSIADPNQEAARRCVAYKNHILDPCFAVPPTVPFPLRLGNAPVYVCLHSPWDTTEIAGKESYTLYAFVSAGSLPGRHTAVSSDSPWALELANGARCLRISSANPTYSCKNKLGVPVGLINGAPDETTSRWTVLYLSLDAPVNGYNTIGVTHSWR